MNAAPETNRFGDALWSPQAQMPSILGNRIVVTEAEGAYLTTSEGNRLLDATAGLWLANIGHSRPELAEVAKQQMLKLENFHIFGQFATDIAMELADRLAAMAPMPNAKVFFGSGGGDAVEIACKLARRYWQVKGETSKKTILSRTGSYHGLHGFGTSLAGLPYNRDGYGTESLISEVAHIPQNDVEGVRQRILELGAENIAAIIAEPVVGSGGVVAPSAGYLQGLQSLAHEYDILFIADEVITGFGRTGEMFASTKYGLTPDMVLMAKGITSGYAPLGGVLIGQKVWEPFYESTNSPVFRHGLTYAGHTTACALALANLDVLEEQNLVPRVRELIGVLHNSVQTLSDHPSVVEVRSGEAFLAAVQLDESISAAKIADHCIEQGVAIRVIHNNSLQISPPFILTDDEVESITTAIRNALAATR